MRLLAPDDYGLIAMATLFSGLFAVVAEIGMGSSIIQSKDVSSTQIRQVYGVVILSNLAIFLLLALVIAPLATLFLLNQGLNQSFAWLPCSSFLPSLR